MGDIGIYRYLDDPPDTYVVLVYLLFLLYLLPCLVPSLPQRVAVMQIGCTVCALSTYYL